MAPLEEDRMPLTLPNVLNWACNKFSDAFDTLPKVGKVTFKDIDDFKFDRPIRRSLGRSEHKKLLIVGAHSPGDEVEDALVCAHIHADDSAINYFWIEEQDNGDSELHTVKSAGHIAFDAPFSDVVNDTSDAKAINRVNAIISYYFLAAGHLNELVRYKKFAKLFTNSFQDGCCWIQNGGKRPTAALSPHVPAAHDTVTDTIAINPSVLRSAAHENPKNKPQRDSPIAQKKPTLKRPALDSLSRNVTRKRPTIPDADDSAYLRAQITILSTETADLHRQLAMQGHAYRGCLVDLSEARENVANLQTQLKKVEEMNAELQDGMKKIKSVLNEQTF